MYFYKIIYVCWYIIPTMKKDLTIVARYAVTIWSSQSHKTNTSR